MCPEVTLLEQPPVAAWPVLSVLGAVPDQAARVAGCWCTPGSVEPSRSQRKPLVGVIHHLVTERGGGCQGRRLSWEKIPEATRLRAGSALGEKAERPPAAPSDAYCQECAGGAGSGHRGASAPAASVSPAQSCFCSCPGITLCHLSEHATLYPHCFGLARLQGRSSTVRL